MKNLLVILLMFLVGCIFAAEPDVTVSRTKALNYSPQINDSIQKDDTGRVVIYAKEFCTAFKMQVNTTLLTGDTTIVDVVVMTSFDNNEYTPIDTLALRGDVNCIGISPIYMPYENYIKIELMPIDSVQTIKYNLLMNIETK